MSFSIASHVSCVFVIFLEASVVVCVCFVCYSVECTMLYSLYKKFIFEVYNVLFLYQYYDNSEANSNKDHCTLQEVISSHYHLLISHFIHAYKLGLFILN